jgi:hypothetical protein
MAAPSSLRARVAAILDPDANHAHARRSAVARVAVLLLLVTVPVAAFHTSAQVESQITSATSTQSARLDAGPAPIAAPLADTSVVPAASAIAATTRAPHPLAPDLSPVDPSPKTTAIAVLDLIQATPLSDPTSVLSAHTFLRSMADTLQRAARAVIDDDGGDSTSTRTKNTSLLNALTNTANAATTIVSRRNTSPETARALIALAAALRTQAADLRAIIPPIVVPRCGRRRLTAAAGRRGGADRRANRPRRRSGVAARVPGDAARDR